MLHVWCLWFGVEGLWFRVQVLELSFEGVRCRVSDSGRRVEALGVWVQGEPSGELAFQGHSEQLEPHLKELLSHCHAQLSASNA